MARWVSRLLTTPVLGSPVGEWLPWLAWFQGCCRRLSLALQSVSGCRGLLGFQAADDACPWLSSWRVPALARWVSRLLTTPVLGSPVREWLPWLAGFRSC